MTYNVILRFWQRVLIWLLQEQPLAERYSRLMELMKLLGAAIHEDTGIESFSRLTEYRETRMGPATLIKLAEIRPALKEISPDLDHWLEFLVSPLGGRSTPSA